MGTQHELLFTVLLAISGLAWVGGLALTLWQGMVSDRPSPDDALARLSACLLLLALGGSVLLSFLAK